MSPRLAACCCAACYVVHFSRTARLQPAALHACLLSVYATPVCALNCLAAESLALILGRSAGRPLDGPAVERVRCLVAEVRSFLLSPAGSEVAAGTLCGAARVLQ